MSHNPYTPPSAAVADVPEPAALARPMSVTIAVVLFFAGLAIELVFWATSYPAMNRGEISALAFFAPMVGFFIAVWLYIKVFTGRNWARITLLVFHVIIVIGLAIALWAALSNAPVTQLLLAFTRPALNTIALVLVFVPGRAWFRPRT
jgi:hypothetical protein